MKVTAEHGENREVTLTIEVDQDKLKKATDSAAKQISGRVNIPGFRRGRRLAGLLRILSARRRFCRKPLRGLPSRRLRML